MVASFNGRVAASACVVGLGASTAVGANARASSAAVRARLAWCVEHPFLIDRTGEPIVTTTAPYLPGGLSGAPRWGALAAPAAAEALAPLSSVVPRSPLPLFLGLPAERPGLPRELPAVLELALKESTRAIWPPGPVHVLTDAHAAGLLAVREACAALARGEAELALAGGCDSYLETETLEWLDWRRQLRSSANRWGFIPGEAAGFCLLAPEHVARRYDLTILGRVLAVGASREDRRHEAGGVNLGEGLSRATRHVLDALPADRKVERILSDMNGERHRVDECGFTMTRMGKQLRAVSSPEAPALCWGDVGAASGPLLMALALLEGRTPSRGRLTLLWTSSEEGARCAALVEPRALAPARRHDRARQKEGGALDTSRGGEEL